MGVSASGTSTTRYSSKSTSKQRKIIFSRAVPIAALGLLVLFKFQNCAPAAQFANNASIGSGSGTVKIVDNWQPGPISFVTASQSVPVTTEPANANEIISQSTSVKGLCVGVSDGSLINWVITSTQDPNQVVNSGQVTCTNGEFQLPVGVVTFNSCSDAYEVRAATNNNVDQSALTLIQPDCSTLTN